MTRAADIGMSFLDTLSCGLGGMILLFLVFSVLEHQGQKVPPQGDDETQTRMAYVTMASEAASVAEVRAPWLLEVSVQRDGVPYPHAVLSSKRAEVEVSRSHQLPGVFRLCLLDPTIASSVQEKRLIDFSSRTWGSSEDKADLLKSKLSFEVRSLRINAGPGDLTLPKGQVHIPGSTKKLEGFLELSYQRLDNGRQILKVTANKEGS